MLCGEAKSQAFANLGFHKLVQLLAIEGEEDREQFVAEHDVEHMGEGGLGLFALVLGLFLGLLGLVHLAGHLLNGGFPSGLYGLRMRR